MNNFREGLRDLTILYLQSFVDWMNTTEYSTSSKLDPMILHQHHSYREVTSGSKDLCCEIFVELGSMNHALSETMNRDTALRPLNTNPLHFTHLSPYNLPPVRRGWWIRPKRLRTIRSHCPPTRGRLVPSWRT